MSHVIDFDLACALFEDLIDYVHHNGAEVTVLKDGRPYVRIAPAEENKPASRTEEDPS